MGAAVDVVIADLSTFRASATELEPQVDAVQSALQDLKTAVEAAGNPAEKATAAVDRRPQRRGPRRASPVPRTTF